MHIGGRAELDGVVPAVQTLHAHLLHSYLRNGYWAHHVKRAHERYKYLKMFRALFRYDVERDDSDKAGEIQVVDGYFAHFVAPENLSPMAKHVIFVLDTSGSMEGKKMQQVKSALKSILNELRINDYFSILQFATDVTEWRPEATPASPQNINEAKTHIEALQAVGGTNIHGGLRKALSRVQSHKARAEDMIIFLTDGHATSGITAKDEILLDISSANAESNVPIFGLAFGRFADFDLLKVLALQNHGFSRKIYIGQVSH